MTERAVPGEHPDDEAVLRHADGAAPRPGEEALFAALDRTRADLAATPRPAPPAGFAASLQAALAAETPRDDPAAPTVERPAAARDTPSRPTGSGPAGRRDPRRPRRARRRLLLVGLTALAAVAVVVGIGVGASGGGGPAPTAAPGPAPVVVAAADLPRAFRSGLGANDPSPLSDPVTRAGCLVAHGLPAGTVPLGTRAVVVDGRPGTLVVLGTGQAGRFRLLVVGPGCAADRPDTVADTTVGG